MTKSITRLDLIEGGTILRQGHFTSLAFSPRDADGAIVDLTGKTIDVVIVGRPGIVYETKGTFDSIEKIIEFKISKNIGHGYMWFEITVTDPNNATYRQKFPTDEYQGKLEFIRSSDDVDYVGFSGKTVDQFKAEQTAFQVEIDEKFERAAAALTEDSEVVLARDGEASLNVKLTKDKQAFTAQLEKTATKVVQAGNKVKTFAHRGAEAYCPENTLKSIELAKQIGFDGIELDVLVTSDGVPVLMHDDTVDRTTNGVGLVKDKTLAEIKALTIDSGNFVAWHSGLKVPTLEEALMVCKKEGLEVIVEIKTFSPSEVTAVERIIAKLGMYETTYILAPYQLAQSLETLNSKLRGMIFHSTNADFKTALTKPNIVAVGIYPEGNVTQAIVDEIRGYGLLVNVATIIASESARRMTDMGIDLITGGVSHV